MKGRFIVIVFVVALMAAMLYEYKHLQKAKVPVNVAITAIPIDASFIFESRKTYPLWKGIAETNLIWKDLLATESVAKLNHNLHFLDSLISENSVAHSIVESQPIFVSAHINGMNQYDYLFVCLVPGMQTETALNTSIQSMGAKGSVSQAQYDGTPVYCLKQPGKSDFYYAISKGIFIASLQVELVHESIRQLESGISLMNNPHFTKVLNAPEGRSVAGLFINYQALYNVAAPYMRKDIHPLIASLQDFAQWSEFDVSYTPNEIMMNGFTDADSLGGQYISLLAHQRQQPTHIPSVAPANTAFMNCFEITDTRAFVKDYKWFLGLHRRINRHNDWVAKIEKDYGINVEKSFYTWLDNEFALVITEPSDSSMQNDTYAIIGTRDNKEALTDLGKLADTIQGDEEKHFTSVSYMNHEIRHIGLDNMLPDLLGGTFEGIKKTYYTLISNYVVFANSPEALQMFIARYQNGNTLEKDSYYQSFTKEHIENSSGIYIYNNVALSPMLYEQYLDKPYADGVKAHTDILRRFQAAGIQFNYMQGMFYTNIYFKRNPEYKKPAGALWQVALDTVPLTRPCWVTDYKTKNKFVFAEDKADNVYLISNMGHIVWKKQVDGKVMGQVYTVDVMKNGKIQYLFNTQKSIYIVDRNGKNVYGFPLGIPAKASAPIALLDYDNNKNYRIVVPCGDNKIRLYNKSGRGVKEWKTPEADVEIKCPVQYVNVEGKDYLVAVDDNGNVYAYDRKGKPRDKIKEKLPAHINAFYITGGKNLKETYLFAADSVGMVYQLSMSDYLTRIKYLSGKDRHPDFAPVDLEGNGKTDMVFLTRYDIYAYAPDKSLLFHYTVDDSLQRNLLTFTYPDGKVKVGAVDTKNNKLYLWDYKGNICKGFPLYGSTAFSIADMNNDGENYLVTGAADNNIYVYSLP